MTADVTVITHSTANGETIATVEARYWRAIHAEVMTHRDFSRNASSSRAIPVARMIADIRCDPAGPIHWGANQKGMQADHELTGWRKLAVKGLWSAGMWIMTSLAWLADKAGAHKQIVNRMIEPWAHINVVITSTKWNNFFGLRCHPDAQPEIKDLADKIRAALAASTPVELQPGDWHLPYVDEEDRHRLLADNRGDVNAMLQDALKVSVARCARVSYKTFDGKRSTVTADLALFDKLAGSQPLHASPAEHQATPDAVITIDPPGTTAFARPDLHGNFHGWRQFRKTLPGEYIP